MLMNSPHSEFQKISPEKRACVYEYCVNSRFVGYSEVIVGGRG